MMPRRALIAAWRAGVMGKPTTTSVPAVGGAKQVTILMVVVLPAPFGPSVYRLAGARHADDDRLTPALVGAGERLPHDLHVADALEGEVDAAGGHLGHRLGDARDARRVDAIGRAEPARHRELLRVEVDADDAFGAGQHGTLDDGESDAAEAE